MKIKKAVIFQLIAISIIALISCSKLQPKMNAPDEALCAPGSLSQAQTVIFAKGNDEFFRVRTASSGLGPYFVSTGCGNCHASDNRGFPSTMVTRFGQTDSTGNQFLAEGAPQLQNYALPGYTPCALPPGATSSKFIPPITAGVGALELVSDADIIAMAEANATNTNGVRGRPNWVSIPSTITPNPNSITQNGKYIGRFGRKAAKYSVLEQVAFAYNEDMGITSNFYPNQPFNYLDNTAPQAPGNIEVDNTTINNVVFYCQGLQYPLQRTPTDSTVMAGKSIFIGIGCADCHKQKLYTGNSPISFIANCQISPYTDLLLHDMGPGLDDGYTEGDAKTSEWRTPPLWGLGLAPAAQGGQYYLLHDGRAHSIDQAIRSLGGEATTSVNRYINLSQSDRDALIKFLESL
jgi:CxxC motif-containing protein (DUF1111 family)